MRCSVRWIATRRRVFVTCAKKSPKTMTIRDEQTGDDHEVDQIITATFANHPDSDQREGWIVKRLCAGNALTLSLVADKGGQIVGHIACSLVQIDGESLGWHGLGPVAVRPEWQRYRVRLDPCGRRTSQRARLRLLRGAFAPFWKGEPGELRVS